MYFTIGSSLDSSIVCKSLNNYSRYFHPLPPSHMVPRSLDQNPSRDMNLTLTCHDADWERGARVVAPRDNRGFT